MVDVSADLLIRYNYDEFVREKFEPWMNFDDSPPVGQPAPSFPLWRMEDESETSLEAIWTANRFTVVEFGSFT
jgi:hypothetical protein